MIYIFRRGYNGHNDSLSSTQAKRLFRATQDHRSDSSKLKGVLMNQQQLTTVGILIFDDVEVLDFCGPFEVFRWPAHLEKTATMPDSSMSSPSLKKTRSSDAVEGC